MTQSTDIARCGVAIPREGGAQAEHEKPRDGSAPVHPPRPVLSTASGCGCGHFLHAAGNGPAGIPQGGNSQCGSGETPCRRGGLQRCRWPESRQEADGECCHPCTVPAL